MRFGGVHGHDINREMQIVRHVEPEVLEPWQLIPKVDGVEGISYENLEIKCDRPSHCGEEAKYLFDNGQNGARN